jgi:hypothetical protein
MGFRPRGNFMRQLDFTQELLQSWLWPIRVGTLQDREVLEYVGLHAAGQQCVYPKLREIWVCRFCARFHQCVEQSLNEVLLKARFFRFHPGREIAHGWKHVGARLHSLGICNKLAWILQDGVVFVGVGLCPFK